MKRFPEIARRAAALALAASMSLSVLTPGAYATAELQPHDHEHDHVHLAAENSVDELGNEDLTDEVFDVPAETDTAAKPVVVETPEKTEEPETSAEEHQWSDWTEGTYQEGEDGEIQNVEVRVCADCGAIELDDGTILHPGTGEELSITNPDKPEWLLPETGSDSGYDDQIALYAGSHSGNHEFNTNWNAPDTGDNKDVSYPSGHYRSTCAKQGWGWVRCTKWWSVTVWGITSRGRCDHWEDRHMGLAPHSYGDWIEVNASCTAAGKRYRVCSVCGHEDIDSNYPTSHPQLQHSWSDWSETKATCTEAGTRTRTCKTCGKVEVDDDYAKAHPATGHNTDGKKWVEGDGTEVGWVIDKEPTCGDAGSKHRTCETCDETETQTIPATGEHTPGEWEVTKEPTCTQPGERVKKCTVCGQIIETDTTSDAVKPLGHDWGEYVDDNKPACCDQYETRTCARCGATDTHKTSGPLRAHKYTRYVLSNIDGDIATRAHCDYEGCDAVDCIPLENDRLSDTGYALAATEASETVANYAESVIKQAMKDTAAAVSNASSREEAIQNLDKIVASVHDQLLNCPVKGEVRIDPGLGGWAIIKVPYSFTLTEDMVKDLMKELQDGVDTVKELLNGSFLSEDAIKSVVNKAADTVVASDDINYSLRWIAYPEVYNAIAGKYPAGDSDKAGEKATISNLILQLAGDVVKSDDQWNEFLDAIIDDVTDMLIDYIKNDEKYGKYLNNSLGEELLKEMRVLIRNELVNDMTFVNEVRKVASDALDHAAVGVNKGWTDEAILKQMREDLQKVQDPVENKLLDLSSKLGDMVESSLTEKINNFLPFGDLTSWIGKWIGSFAKDKVNEEISGETGTVRKTIDLYINYITCGTHDKQQRIARYASCTEPEITETYCTKCGWVFKKEETAPALGHDPVTVAGYPATETVDGLTDGVQCRRCGEWLEPQEVIPALTPEYDKWYVKANVTAETVKAAGYKSQQKLDEAIDNALKKAGFEPANSERFLAQVQTNLDVLKDEYDREPGEGASRILTNDRYPDEGVTGMVKFPAKAPGKDGTYYAVQIITADCHGYSAGDVIVTPLTVTEEGIAFKTGVQAVVAIAWKPNN